ncbi:hypothetical protein HPB47_016546 [Ixodes persulcatus]|uniref:Uncharacterized protein n=1 Tax=Ixodes persulcatus TaxID=34615 RepID=A0AC60QSP4_IXOPE|nr:hypothetical protein HPB47_016546 [Ixodes persulcatus]
MIAITSDMGAGNRAMWKGFNILAGRQSKLSCSTSHPDDLTKIIHVLVYVPHIVKHLRNHLCCMQQITLPQDIVSKHSLPSGVVHVWRFNKLIAHEKGKTFKLAPGLTETHLSEGHFDKMKVSFTVELMSHKTACAIEELVKKHVISPRALLTTWFFITVKKRFALIRSRHPDIV